MILFSTVYLEGPIYLLGEEHPYHLMGEGEAGEGEAVTDRPQLVGNSEGTADDEAELAVAGCL